MSLRNLTRRQYLLSQCRYYNGESEPPRSLPEGCALMWDYEWHWVLWSLKNDPMMEQFQRKIEEFHLENKEGDDTPLTMKALLLNRYLHWYGAYASIEETLKHFEKWYESHYLIWSTNDERKAYASPIFGISRHRMGVDGKGVTTLVTFMGCPLKCRYCLNDQCHEDIYEEDGRTLRRGILMLTPQQLYDIVKQDNIYFQATGGGICFGGGEPTMQEQFIIEFAKLCPKNWKITLETSLDCSFNTIKALAPYVDEWIVDIKSMNADIYYRYTGTNSAVHQHLECAKRLLSPDKVTIKVPHIPDFTTEDDVRESVRELRELGFTNIVECEYVKRITRITK